MYLDKEKKTEIFGKYGKGTTDTGSAEAQIALFTYRIAHLTEHVKANHKDYVTTRALTQLVGKRRRLLSYLKERDINRYRAIIKALGLRKSSAACFLFILTDKASGKTKTIKGRKTQVFLPFSVYS